MHRSSSYSISLPDTIVFSLATYKCLVSCPICVSSHDSILKTYEYWAMAASVPAICRTLFVVEVFEASHVTAKPATI